MNSIAWLLWHVAPAEDIGVNRFAADRREVFEDGGWAGRIGIARRDLGTGMTSDEVGELSDTIDLGGLRGYWTAVGARTIDVLRGMEPRTLETAAGMLGYAALLMTL